MKTLLFSYKFLFVTLMSLPLALCSSEDNSETDNPVVVDPDNPDTTGGGDNSNAVASEDISTLWIGNFTMAGKGEWLEIMHGKESTFYSNAKYRTELSLPNDAVIGSVTGASYYKGGDGKHPTKPEDMFVPWSSVDGNILHDHPNVTISFTFVDEDQANAYIMIDSPMTFNATSYIIRGDQSSRSIEKGSFSIHANEDKLEDEVPPLWKDSDADTGVANKNFKFNAAKDITDKGFNGLMYGSGGVDLDVGYSDIVDMFKEQGKKIWIKIIEVGIVDGEGKRLKLAQPALQKTI